MANIAAQAASSGASAQSVLNHGFFGSGGLNMAQQLANQQLANQSVAPINQTPAVTSGVGAVQQAVLNAQNFAQQMSGANMAEQAGLDAAVEAGGNPYADDESNMITAGMAVGDAPVATAGNFNPQTQFAAQRMFGRQKFRRKPLITF